MTDSAAGAPVRGYADFIDGLRAIAILAVVAFHVGLPAPTGGFFGVDIFFVISGFLIIGQIVTDCERRTFRFGTFWARRVLRILPSYLLVILCSVLLSFVVLVSPSEFAELGEQVTWSAGMAMNSWLIRHVGYFDTDGNVKELLHLWSLAVEEQFYIVAPIAIAGFLALTARVTSWIPRWLSGGFALAVALGVSFWSAMSHASGPNSEFFFHTEMRAWEFLAGGAAALLPQAWWEKVPLRTNELLGIIGAGLLAFGIFGLGTSASFPSLETVIPVAGTALLLAAGIARNTFLTAALGWRPLRAVGLVSYAWYLWHWPLLSFAYIANFADQSVVLRIVCAVISLLLAALTYWLIEKPLRQRRRSLARRAPWRIVASGVAACVAIMALGWWLEYQWSPVLSAGIPPGMVPARANSDPDCLLSRALSADRCLDKNKGRPAVLLIGDSHAGVAAATFEAAARDHGRFLIDAHFDGCAPFLDTHVIGPYQKDNLDCLGKQDDALERIAGQGVDIPSAIIEAQWIFHTVGDRPLGADPSVDDHHGFVDAIAATLNRLHALGVRRVLILAPIPLYALSPALCLLRADHEGVSRDACSITRATADSQREVSIKWLREATEGRRDVVLADPLPAFCDGGWCRPYQGDNVYYSDYSHLDSAGTEHLYAATKPAFDWLFAPD